MAMPAPMAQVLLTDKGTRARDYARTRRETNSRAHQEL
jgi:hypothetical protein